MAEEMGNENIFIFGMTVDEVEDLKRRGYNAWDYYNKLPEAKQCIDQIQNGFFSPNNPDEFKDIGDVLMKWDRYFLLADYESYIKSQDLVAETYKVRTNFLFKHVLQMVSLFHFWFCFNFRTKTNGWRWQSTTSPRQENSRRTEQSKNMLARSGDANQAGKNSPTHMSHAIFKF